MNTLLPLLLLTSGLALGQPAPADPSTPARPAGPLYEVPRRAVEPAELERVFDTRWLLPEPQMSRGRVDLVTRMKRLATERWSEDPSHRFRCVGDLFLAADDVRHPKGRKALLKSFRAEQPAAWKTWGDLLEELLLDESLRDEDWSPSDDEDDDGIAMDDPWSLDDARRAPWKDIGGNEDVHQGVAWILADLETIKAVENDYAAYPDDPRNSYESVYPLEGRHVGCTTGRVALQVHFRTDLPWPFGSMTCRMQVLHRLDDDGHLVTDVVSLSDDFYWFAGRDVFVPVRDDGGRFAGFLTVRWFGFDVDGVPDGSGTRRSALRAGLGRLKRLSEPLYRGRTGDGPSTVEGAVPEFVVRGDRRWKR